MTIKSLFNKDKSTKVVSLTNKEEIASDVESVSNYTSQVEERRRFEPHVDYSFAQNFAKKIILIIENLNNFPKMGRIVPELENVEIREIIYRNFRIIYRLKQNIIEIARIIHGSRILRI